RGVALSPIPSSRLLLWAAFRPCVVLHQPTLLLPDTSASSARPSIAMATLKYGYVNDTTMIAPPMLRKIGLNWAGNSSFVWVGTLDDICNWMEVHRRLQIEYEEAADFHSKSNSLALHVKTVPIENPSGGWVSLLGPVTGYIVEVRLAQTSDLARDTWAGAEEQESREEAPVSTAAAQFAQRNFGVMWRGSQEEDLSLILLDSSTTLGECAAILKDGVTGWRDLRKTK
ncbi:uncharacterized protein BJ171DRAFT_200930, partial [Polychytrium aggregatum]|uniref:uncharacterized protein n=1 Tax=Polychytrium aggregatum TaxID=110093 RepID=UPI0022FEEB3C